MNYIYTWLGFAIFIACVTIIPARLGDDYAAGYSEPFWAAGFIWLLLDAICAALLFFIWLVRFVS